MVEQHGCEQGHMSVGEVHGPGDVVARGEYVREHGQAPFFVIPGPA
ncbi:hypothetical protein [Wenjunlia tyrosinilytica]|nr:hypothetical protein [Wenjunlia tyrosinilytica]